jgi:hypothetical protein
MRSLNARLTALEARLGSPQIPWADLAAAIMRSQARTRLKVCRLLSIDPEDARVIEAARHLTHDTPAQAQADDALVASWRQGSDRGEVRVRLMARLDEMAARLDARAQ